MFTPALRSPFKSFQRPLTEFYSGGLGDAVAAIYSVGRTGFQGSPSNISSLFQDSAGTTPVTAVEQPVGFAVDRSIGGVRGPELVTNGTFATDTAGWATSNATLSVVAGRLRITNTAPNGGAIQGEATIIGKTYICSADFSKSAVNGVLSVTNNIGGGGSFASVFGVATGPLSFMFVATAATTYVVPYINAGVAGDIADFDNISVKLLDGNHATQPTAASRPIYRKDVAGYSYLAYDGIDDSLSSATGGSGTAGFFFCAAISLNSFAGTPVVFTDVGAANTGYTLQVSSLGIPGFYAGTGTATFGVVSASAMVLNVRTMITVWHDGANINLQIGSGAVASTAHTLTAAGTTGFNLGRYTGQTNFVNGNLYETVYARNTGLTASERATIQAYVMQQSGL